MLTLFLIGTVWFWLLLIAEFVLLLLFVELERPGFATVSLVATFSLLAFFGNFNLIAAVKAHPIDAAIGLGIYFVGGTLWSFGKWFFFVRKSRETFDDLKAQFDKTYQKKYSIKVFNDESHVHETVEYDIADRDGFGYKKAIVHFVLQKGGRSALKPPRASENKHRILLWMAYWPTSMLWTIINDPVKRVFKEIFRQVRGWYDAIAKQLYKGVPDVGEDEDKGGW
jgi:hypothetical protein